MMAVAAAQKNREMFAMKKSYSIEVYTTHNILLKTLFSIYINYFLKKKEKPSHSQKE